MESLHFKIALSGTYWDRRPQYSISVDGKPFASDIVSRKSDEIFYVDFIAELKDQQEHILKIRLENKTEEDTIVEHGHIVKDMLLNVNNIKVDDIDLGILLWRASRFTLDNPCEFNGETITHIDECINLGWNGAYELKFTTPFYIWLLDHM